MRPLALLSLALLLSSCTDPYRDLTPDAAVEKAHEAAAQGDAGRALGLLRSASHREHLGAMAMLAAAYESGYLQAEAGAAGQATAVPIRTWPWDGGRWRRIYDAEVERRAADRELEGLHVHASRFLEPSHR